MMGKDLFTSSTNNKRKSTTHDADTSGKFSKDLVVQNQSRTDLQALDEKVKSMMEKGQKMIPDGGKQYRDGTPKQSTSSICKVCGKEGLWTQIRDHIEAHHLEGVFLPCNHVIRLSLQETVWAGTHDFTISRPSLTFPSSPVRGKEGFWRIEHIAL